uniref:Thioredoxin domain-containing protein n=1 Tax=Fibrocapsa japonica TaxID=94617 RepID=A0A7S2UTI0_9STRA
MDVTNCNGDCQLTRQIQIGELAPNFQATALLPTGTFGTLSLGDFIGQGRWLLLFFYPLDFSFVCPTEITAFSDNIGAFRKLGCEVVGCSGDSQFCHLYWTKIPRSRGGVGKLEFPLLADVTRSVSRAYGVLVEDKGVAIRGMFLVDPRGVVRHATHNDLPAGRSVLEALRLLHAYTQAFQEESQQIGASASKLCPMEWHPVTKTSKTNTKRPKECFISTSADATCRPSIKRPKP